MRLKPLQNDLRRRRIQRVCYLFLGLVADFIQDALGLFQNERARYMPSEASHWSPEETLEKCKHSTPMEDARHHFGDGSVFIIDDATVTKCALGHADLPYDQQREVLNMRFVLEHTTIPIPNIYHVLPCPDSDLCDPYIVMDYVHGQRLDHAWPRLSLWQKLRIAWVLRSYIRQLRRIQHPRSLVPGPLGPNPRPCPEGTLDSIQDQGPFANAVELTAFLNARSKYNGKIDVPRGYEVPEPLVFTHADLNMRNIILDDDGRVWIIDWDWSGFYPKSWEFISMSIQAESHPLGPLPVTWRRCVPFITSPDFGRYRWLVGRPP